ncbi:hypothetical protein [Paraburkholderia sp. BCC1886]|uniref:hypothetical protein n=1 Tax=Paraburkholderia sp. BCC1886 TaxID=2562670 RepID=UPI00118428DA|nr:hypothetical protein [Paraburkholderia sp. BCC1886]
MLTYAIQKAGYDYDQLDSQGSTDFAGFIRALENFPWAAQLALWNETQDGPLPALVLKNEEDQRELWISVLGTELGESFQLNAVSMQEKKGLFGFGKPKMDRTVTTFNVEGRSKVDRLCELLCSREYALLDEEVTRLDQLSRDLDEDS